ncbi:MAG: class IV adenylate cyclase [Myxococcales bacterium]|nr:class IV adenylate cyclase [Myxococcales bacterium]
MARNVEIKAHLSADDLERVRKAAVARSSRAPELLHQRDTFYSVPCGRLKLRHFRDGGAELIAYERPDRAGPKTSSYIRSPCADEQSLDEALRRSVGLRGVVEKRREVIYVGQTRVHLDEVAGLGRFLELEVVLADGQDVEEGQRIALKLMDAFEIKPESLVEEAYVDLLEAT